MRPAHGAEEYGGTSLTLDGGAVVTGNLADLGGGAYLTSDATISGSQDGIADNYPDNLYPPP